MGEDTISSLHSIGMSFLRRGRSLLGEEDRLTVSLVLFALLFRMSLVFAAYLFLILYIVTFHGDFWYRSAQTLNRDLSGLLLIILIKIDLWKRLKANEALDVIWMRVVKKQPHKIAMIDIETGKSYSFQEFNSLINQYAYFFKSRGLKMGDCVALFIENSSHFVAAWMALAKLGVVSAWINSNLKSGPLGHCIETSKAKMIVTSETLADTLSRAVKNGDVIMDTCNIFVLGSSPHFTDIIPTLTSSSTKEPRRKEAVDFKSVLCFIYTSGTTGLPKAAVMKHFRYYSIVAGAAMSFGIRRDDTIYVSMPIYHTAAGILGVGQCVIRGSTCVIRKKFSASNFWKDCVTYKCTTSQYIGEICRYLLAQKIVPEEKTHSMRLLYGNGLRAEIWKPFVDRFRVRIGELYGSTEGTSSLVNIDGHIGACGFLPISPLTKKMHPVRLIKVDDERGEIVRRTNGLCLPCNPGETGAMVSTIRKNNPLLQFEGYLNEQETSKKIIHNVFTHGDSCFLTGDLLHWDRLGYVYFKDRTGDTYRWKGENVSTTEVEAIVHPLSIVADATVYGVRVPGCEGRAGMLAIVKRKESDPDKTVVDTVCERLQCSLAPYALPLFIRLSSSVDLTGTFKLIKTNLQRLGYSCETDKVFVFDKKVQQYIRLTDEIKDTIDREEFNV